jgi:hypothetical protein
MEWFSKVNAWFDKFNMKCLFGKRNVLIKLSCEEYRDLRNVINYEKKEKELKERVFELTKKAQDAEREWEYFKIDFGKGDSEYSKAEMIQHKIFNKLKEKAK